MSTNDEQVGAIGTTKSPLQWVGGKMSIVRWHMLAILLFCGFIGFLGRGDFNNHRNPTAVVDSNNATVDVSRVEELEATLHAERVGRRAEMTKSAVCIMELRVDKNTLRNENNALKRQRAEDLLKKSKEYAQERSVLNADSESRMDEAQSDHAGEIEEKDTRIEELKSQITAIYKGMAKFREKSSEKLEQLAEQYEAQLKVLNDALKKAIRERGEAEGRALRANNGVLYSPMSSVLSMSHVFCPGKKIAIKKISVGSSYDGETYMEIFLDELIGGKLVLLTCEVAEKDACDLKKKMKEEGKKWIRFNEEDVCIIKGVVMRYGKSFVLVRYDNAQFNIY